MVRASTGIRKRIDHILPSLRPAERKVAEYMRDHIDTAAKFTVGQLARTTEVSQPTVIRFSRKLGFDGYKELRYTLGDTDAGRHVDIDPLADAAYASQGHIDAVPGRISKEVERFIGSLSASLDHRELTKIISALVKAPLIDIYATGDSVPSALDLALKLSYLGLQARFNVDLRLQQIGAGHLKRDDVAIALSNPGDVTAIVSSLHFADRARATTIAVATRANPALESSAGMHMIIGGSQDDSHCSPLFFAIAQHFFVDALYLGIIASDYGRFSNELERTGHILKYSDASDNGTANPG